MRTYLLREARDRAKLTQEQLADLADVDQTTISRLETDSDPNPTTRTVERLAKALGIRPVQLRFSEPEPDAIGTRASVRVGHSSHGASR